MPYWLHNYTMVKSGEIVLPHTFHWIYCSQLVLVYFWIHYTSSGLSYTRDMITGLKCLCSG